MIFYYTLYKKNTGEIVSFGSTQFKEEVEANVSNEVDVIWKQASLNQYVENGSFIDIPERPSSNYIFDYTTKQWVFDTVKANVAALQRRDKLLADGPDRISPIWWSSMTPEQQQSWADYRQALLDITSQPNYPQEIVWPVKP